MNPKNTTVPAGFKITKCPASDRSAPSLKSLRRREERCIMKTGMTMVELAKDKREAAAKLEANNKRIKELERQLEAAELVKLLISK